MTAREAAYTALLKYENNASYSNIELDGTIKKYALSGVEKNFFTALFYGVIERAITLDYYIEKLSDRSPADIDKNVLIMLRMGLYQIIYMSKVPDSAAVNESVALARRFYARKNSESFVNAILRSFLREREKLALPDERKAPLRSLSVRYSVKEWICEMLVRDFGYEGAKAVLASFEDTPKMTIRVNTLKTSREKLQKKLADAGILSENTEYSPVGLRLKGATPYSALAPFEEEFFVQDEASQLACLALCACRGDKVLDACACPGGKSFSIAMAMENEGELYSCDLHKNKLSLISSGAEKLGITIIETAERNATSPTEEKESFDKILLDVPCSGLGVIAKKPDIRHKNKADIERLPAVQEKILSSSAPLLKRGGTLVYSTCTLNKDENENIINKFLAENPDFSLCPFELGALKTDGMITLLPNIHGTDGFFIAKLKKK